MIFGKIRRAYGGRVKAILSGAAPLKPEVSEFLRIAFSCPVIEGFGMAETSAFSVVVQTVIL